MTIFQNFYHGVDCYHFKWLGGWNFSSNLQQLRYGMQYPTIIYIYVKNGANKD